MLRVSNNLLASVIRFQRRVEPWAFEAALVACSLWAGKCLLLPPSNFNRYLPDNLALAGKLELDGLRWAIVALVAAAFKAAGLATMRWRSLSSASLAMRCFGLILSCVFWLVMGVFFLGTSLDLISSVPAIMLGLGAAWILLRQPRTLPHESH